MWTDTGGTGGALAFIHTHTHDTHTHTLAKPPTYQRVVAVLHPGLRPNDCGGHLTSAPIWGRGTWGWRREVGDGGGEGALIRSLNTWRLEGGFAISDQLEQKSNFRPRWSGAEGTAARGQRLSVTRGYPAWQAAAEPCGLQQEALRDSVVNWGGWGGGGVGGGGGGGGPPPPPPHAPPLPPFWGPCSKETDKRPVRLQVAGNAPPQYAKFC